MNKTITGTQVPAANEAILAALRKVHNIASPASTAPEDLKRQRLVLFSPWTDMTASGESYEACRDRDPLLTREYIEAVREAYAPGADWAQAAYSPLFADLRGLPPTLIQVGGREILRDDSTRLHQNLQAAGVPAVLQTWPEMWHVFQMFPLKAAGEAMDQMARYLELLR